MFERPPSGSYDAPGPRSRTGSVAPQGFRRTDGAQNAIRRDSIGRGRIYVRSSNGSNSNSGGSWREPLYDMGGCTSRAVAGDTVYVSQAHASSITGTASDANFASTASKPIWVLCVQDDKDIPDTLATTATHTTSGAAQLNTGTGGTGYYYYYGFSWISGSGASANDSINLAAAGPGTAHFEKCKFQVATTNVASQISIPTSSSTARLVNCDMSFNHTGQTLRISTGGNLLISGGSILAGSATPTSFLTFSGTTNQNVTFEDFDFSNFASTFNVMSGLGAGQTAIVTLRRCKMPASWSGAPCSGSIAVGNEITMEDCDSADTNYRFWRQTCNGSIKSETTLVMTGGVSDGTTPLSWNMTTLATVLAPLGLRSKEFTFWNDTIGSAITINIEILHDAGVAAGQGSGAAGAFTNEDIWIEGTSILGTSGFPLGLNVANTPNLTEGYVGVGHPASSATWTTTGMSSPMKQTMQLTVTPQEKGPMLLTVVMAVPGKTCYVNWKPAIT